MAAAPDECCLTVSPLASPLLLLLPGEDDLPDLFFRRNEGSLKNSPIFVVADFF